MTSSPVASDRRTKHQHPKGKGCWYFVYVWECPVCGRGGETRERRWTPKPDNPADRVEFNGLAYDHCLDY